MKPKSNQHEWLLRRTADLLKAREQAECIGHVATELRDCALELENRIRSLESSVSWRVTSPLRHLQHLLVGNKWEKKEIKIPPPVLADGGWAWDCPPLIGDHPSVAVDVSSLCASNAGGGIQRVVGRLAAEWVKTSGLAVQCVDLRSGWPSDAAGRFGGLREPVPVLRFSHLLLLDASWNYLDQVRAVVKQARAGGIKVISCLYDMIPIDHPETCLESTRAAYARWFSEAVKWSDAFVCISQSVANRLARHFAEMTDERTPEIGWWKMGSDLDQAESLQAERLVERPYALMVGTLEPRKNHRLVLEAFESAWERGELDHALVFVGRPGWAVENLLARLAVHPERSRRLFWFRDASDQQLVDLYKNADVVIQPSIAEGFGLPVVEAGRYAKPVVLSDIEVFREIVHLNGYFFRADSVPDFLDALRLALAPGAKPTVVLQTSWSDSARELLELVRADAYQIRSV